MTDIKKKLKSGRSGGKQMPRHKTAHTLAESEELTNELTGQTVSYTASLVSQGDWRFYTLTVPSDVLAETCTVDTQEANPQTGFQRRLDEKRALDIAEYIDNGLGTIPGSVVVSAQPRARLDYNRPARTLRFRKSPGALLIIDGQHRVYGFQKSHAKLRVPVVIYNGLTKAQEAQLFMDINTKQRPVPNELLLAIKRLAQTETTQESILRDIFDLFDKEKDSPLLGLMSSSERKRDKISRVTFNKALRPIFETLGEAKPSYDVLSPYIRVWIAHLRAAELQSKIVNPTLFRAIILLFPAIAEKVSDRFGAKFSADHFADVLRPVFTRIKNSTFQSPGNSPSELFNTLRRPLESGFTIGRARGN